MKQRWWIPLVLIWVTLLVFWRLEPQFLDIKYLLGNSTMSMEMGLLAIGLTFVITTGNIDLSVASMLTLSACMTAKLLERGMSLPLSVLFAACFGGLLGLVNGLMVAKLKLPSFLVTLGTMAAYRGVAQAMLGPNSVKIPAPAQGLDRAMIGGLPWPVVIFLVLAIALGFVLSRSVFGRWVTALGSNESAANYSGVPVDRVKVLVFVLTGVLAGIGGAMIDSRLGVARHELAKGMELEAITVVVVGGSAITGGFGSMLGTVLALILMVLVRTGMGVANVKAETQLLVIGVLLVVAALTMNEELGARWLRGLRRRKKE